MTGQLFTHYFLTDGIRATPEWQASAADPQTFAAFRESLLQRHETLARAAEPNEAVTEQDLIRPVLELLGWADYLPQQRTAGNEDIPDHLLFADAGSKERASAERNAGARARYALALEESKRFGLSLDERDREAGFHARSPHSQILRYLATAEIESESRLRWGLPHQRPRLAPVRLPRPAPGQRLLRGRPGGPARARPRRGGCSSSTCCSAGHRSRPRKAPLESFLEAALAEGPPLRGAGRPGSVGGGLRECLPGPRPGPRRRRAERGHRRQPAGGPQGGPHLPLPPALRALRRGPGAAAGQRLPLRRLRPAQAGARRRRPTG